MTTDRLPLIAGRVMLALLFLFAGAGKIAAVGPTMGYMAAMGVPGILIWPTIALEIGGGIALAIGWRTAIVAPALAAFTLVAAAIFHHHFADQMQLTMFLKDVAIAGGLLLAAKSTGTAVNSNA